MKKIQLDFAPPGLGRSVCSTSFLTWLTVCVAVVVCISALFAGWQQKQQIDAQLEVIQNLNKKLAQRKEVKSVANKKEISDAQASEVNTAIAQLNLPWRAVFEAVEAATPQTIALLSLEPDARRNSVKGIAEAKDSEEMVRYIEQLKKQSFFSNVFITMHDINQLDPNKPMRFQFEAYWRSAVS
jgi:Tfp pilus assembly protein PilN